MYFNNIRIIVLVFSIIVMGNTRAIEDTKISEDYFELTLPGEWYPVSKNPYDYYQYRSKNGLENLSVSVHFYKNKIRADEEYSMLNDFLKLRLGTEKKIAKSKHLQISHIVQQKQKDAISGFYEGFQPEIDRRFAAFIIARTYRIILFYYETLDIPENQFKLATKQVISHIKLRR